MPTCKQCGEVYGILDMAEDGVCKYCFDPTLIKREEEARETLRQERIALEEKQKEFMENKTNILISTLATTETNIEGIEKRIGIVSSQYVEGTNVFKDFFASARDFWGGRIKSIEEILETAQDTLIDELKEKTFFLGGNGVIGVKIEHTYNNAGGGNIVSVIATGTAVKFREND